MPTRDQVMKRDMVPASGMIPYDKDGASKSHLPVQTTTAGFPDLGTVLPLSLHSHCLPKGIKNLKDDGRAQKKLQSMHARGIRLIGLVDVVDSKQSQNKHTVANIAGMDSALSFCTCLSPLPLIAGPISIVNTSDQVWQVGLFAAPRPVLISTPSPAT